MTDKEFFRLGGRMRCLRRRLHRWHDRLTPRQRRRIVLTALALFAAADVWLLLRGAHADAGHIEIPYLKP